MFKIFIVCLMFSVSILASAKNVPDSENKYLEFMTKKTLEDFQSGIEKYNSDNSGNNPKISKDEDQLYSFSVKKNTVHFSIVNYLNDQVYINNVLVQKSTFGLNKTTWLNYLIDSAVAEDVNLDAESTKVILSALGSLTKNLDDVGMICFSGCKKETREKNLKKILTTLDEQKTSCAQEQYQQEDSIKRYSAHSMASLLHSTLSPEFASLKNFFKKISDSNKKSVDKFMVDKLGIDKNYKTCIGVMTSGTILDGSFDNMDRGKAVLASGMLVSSAKEAALEQAREVCLKMEELKSCLITLQENLGTINSIKRGVKKNTGVDFPQESLPSINGISR